MQKTSITMESEKFMNEWKQLLSNVRGALLFSGYDVNELSGMDNFIEEYNAIKNLGVLYNFED
ncbi:hypothetical protein [Listeria cornellensis]|uniref:hypothetical protein n=1 Tax=Listeria cornellensis TaxID=1494961 RepID=UPI0004ADE8EA|nr:hypothetical protein [Listeria cornellensis]